jgi:hypothetical protein
VSLDDPRGWKTAERIERGDPPLTVERAAAQRIGSALFKHLDAHGTFTDRFKTEVGAKVLGHELFIRSVFDDVKADPRHIGDRDPIVLRRQGVNRYDDLDSALELAAYHQREADHWLDMVDRIRTSRLPEHDPDAVAQDREDDRAREQRQDAAASERAPKVAS